MALKIPGLAGRARLPVAEADQETYDARIATCGACPKRFEITGSFSVCKVCGCPVARKARPADAACPDGRW